MIAEREKCPNNPTRPYCKHNRLFACFCLPATLSYLKLQVPIRISPVLELDTGSHGHRVVLQNLLGVDDTASHILNIYYELFTGSEVVVKSIKVLQLASL